jgi:hypothetical protein
MPFSLPFTSFLFTNGFQKYLTSSFSGPAEAAEKENGGNFFLPKPKIGLS